MLSRKLKDNIFSVGAIDWDRRLFDELIPLPDGTSYNSYLIKGKDKIALIDTVDPAKAHVLVENLASLGVEKIDYIVAHHGEQDHSGSLTIILEMYKGAKIICSPKCKEILRDLLLIDDNRFVVVSDHETLSLGDKTLEFIYAPWVHWPETMLTYLREDSVLFTCDLFGSHLATSDLFVSDEARVYESAKRYFAEIMMPFRIQIRSNIEKIKGLKIDVIAPSHGPVYDKPEFIISAYKEWISDKVANVVVLPYVSMHGSVSKMAEYLIDALIKRNIAVKPFNLSRTDIGELAISLVDAATIVIGSPTVLAGAHPLAIYAATLANALRPKTKFASMIGSYSWGGKMVEHLASLIPNLKVEIIAPVVAKGYPKREDFASLEKLADEIYGRHKQLGLM